MYTGIFESGGVLRSWSEPGALPQGLADKGVHAGRTWRYSRVWSCGVANTGVNHGGVMIFLIFQLRAWEVKDGPMAGDEEESLHQERGRERCGVRRARCLARGSTVGCGDAPHPKNNKIEVLQSTSPTLDTYARDLAWTLNCSPPAATIQYSSRAAQLRLFPHDIAGFPSDCC